MDLGSRDTVAEVLERLSGHEKEYFYWKSVLAGFKSIPVRQSPQGSRRGSSADFVCGFKGVYKRPGIRGYLVEIDPLWKGTMWLRNFKTPQAAAHARAAVAFCCSRQGGSYNHPELQGTFHPLPSHLQPNCVEDHEETTNFMQKQALEAACKAKNSETGAQSSNPSAVNECTENERVDSKVDADPVTTIIAANTIEAKLEGNVGYPTKAVKADATWGDSMCRPLEDLDDVHECTNHIMSEDEESSGGSLIESQAEDSPSHETNSKDAGRKRPGDPIDEDDLISRLAPLIKRQIEDALKSNLLPLVSRTRAGGQQKYREQMLALEEQKLAMKREKMLSKRRRVGRS